MKKQVIEQLQNTLEGVMQEWINTKQELAEMEIRDAEIYTDLDNKYQVCESELIKTEKELEDTQEALSRNRNQLESYKMFESMYISSEYAREWLVKSLIKWETMSVFEFIIKKFK